MKPLAWSLSLFLVATLLSACAVTESRAGVPNLWRAEGVEFSDGKTTSSEVLKVLGPPSQLIALGNRTVFYYLFEQTNSAGLFLFVYNTHKLSVTHDRAVFFFDDKGVLEEHSLSANVIRPSKRK